MKYTDEHLSAFLDGQLSRDKSEGLELELSANAELAERLASLEEANEAVKDSYSAELDQPIPDHILALLEPQVSHAHAATNDNGTRNVVPLMQKRVKFSLSKWAAPLAASFAMMLGLTVGRGMTLASIDQGALYAQMTGVIAADNPLFEVLETTPSATNVRYGKDKNLEIKPILTFTSNDGSYCREFKAQTTQSAARGVACRDGSVWNVLMLNQTERSYEGGFRTASGNSDAVIDQFIDGLLVGIPLDADGEQTLLNTGWKK
ncbi:MAG: hypothetical protein L3J65_01705 [Robiginitomaculum sp.]|nr:hypothetical protein [Robiginitomaculum sp.]